jgi:hypothetical protein
VNIVRCNKLAAKLTLVILKDGNFHWDLEEQKEEKRQRNPF